MAEQEEFFRIAVRAIGLFTSSCNFSTEKIRAIVGQSMPRRGTKKFIHHEEHEGHVETIGFRVKADGRQGNAGISVSGQWAGGSGRCTIASKTRTSKQWHPSGLGLIRIHSNVDVDIFVFLNQVYSLEIGS